MPESSNEPGSFARHWAADLLGGPPLIAPARVLVWPKGITGEEDALARGAVYANVRPAGGGAFLVQCALGFRDPSMPTGIFSCPDPGQICIVAGGYAYLAEVAQPERVTLLAMKPVLSVVPAPEARMLLFVGFHTVLAWGVGGQAWESARLSWEGVRVTGLAEGKLHGFGWDLIRDQELPFSVDLATGKHTGGGYSGR